MQSLCIQDPRVLESIRRPEPLAAGASDGPDAEVMPALLPAPPVSDDDDDDDGAPPPTPLFFIRALNVAELAATADDAAMLLLMLLPFSRHATRRRPNM